MYVFFADDSSTTPRRERLGRLVAFGGVFFPSEALAPVEERANEILQDMGVPLDTEVKWSLPPGNWIRENLGERREELYCRLLAAAREGGGRVIVAGVDTDRRDEVAGKPAFEFCMDCVFERLTTHLAKAEDHAIIIADRPGGGRRDEEQFLANFLERVQEGTEFVPPDRVVGNERVLASGAVCPRTVPPHGIEATLRSVAVFHPRLKPILKANCWRA